jgi:hypothetical protein
MLCFLIRLGPDYPIKDIPVEHIPTKILLQVVRAALETERYPLDALFLRQARPRRNITGYQQQYALAGTEVRPAGLTQR